MIWAGAMVGLFLVYAIPWFFLCLNYRWFWQETVPWGCVHLLCLDYRQVNTNAALPIYSVNVWGAKQSWKYASSCLPDRARSPYHAIRWLYHVSSCFCSSCLHKSFFCSYLLFYSHWLSYSLLWTLYHWSLVINFSISMNSWNGREREESYKEVDSMAT